MLYLKLGRPALGKTMNLVSQSAAEEIVQEVFTKLWHKKMLFPNLKSAFAWVYKCCTNAAIDYLRNSNNSHASFDENLQKAESDLERNTLAKQEWSRVVKILGKDEAELFIYRDIEGLSQDEVAEVMKISRRTVNRLQEKLDLKLEKIRRERNV